MVDAVSGSRSPLQHQELPLKVRGVRLQNAIFNVVAFGSAHGEEAISLQLVYLPPHQMQHMGTDAVYLSAAPFLCRIGCQCIIVFMVAVHERQREGQTFQAAQCFIVPCISEPYAAKVPCDHDHIVLRHLCLLRKVFRPEPFKVSVAVARCPYHILFLRFG